MANAIVTLNIMEESPDINLEKLEEQALKLITEFNDGKETKTVIEPIAFGLKALKITFVMDETKGGTDELEKKIEEIEGVQSVECVDVRRAVG